MELGKNIYRAVFIGEIGDNSQKVPLNIIFFVVNNIVREVNPISFDVYSNSRR